VVPGALVVALVLAGAGSASISPKALCKPLSPTQVRLPAGVAAMSNYTYQLNSNAQAHSALCNIGLASPSDAYTYNVDVEAFPSHKLAVADFGGLDVASAYRQIVSKTAAKGFPGPNFELTGFGARTGSPVSDVTFVDGDALVSAYVLGSGTLPKTLALGKWAVSDLKSR
jgi:hypothetical protein